MEKFKEYFKVFAYIFYPGMVLILYLAQGLEGKLGLDLIFCPTDIIVLLAILGIYMLLDAFKVFDAKAVSYTHLRAHETGRNVVCRLLLEKKKKEK